MNYYIIYLAIILTVNSFKINLKKTKIYKYKSENKTLTNKNYDLLPPYEIPKWMVKKFNCHNKQQIYND
jgi:hypothetical protein